MSRQPALIAARANLLGYWPLSGQAGNPVPLTSGAIADTSGQNHPLTALDMAGNGSMFYGAGAVGSGISCDGDDRLSSNAAVFNNMPAVTASLWIRPVTASVTNDRIIIYKQTAGGQEGWRLGMSTGHLQFMATFGAPGSMMEAGTAASIPLNTWTHVAVVWDGTATAANVRLYLNGVRAAPGYLWNGTGPRMDDSTTPLVFGGANENLPLIGDLDELAIFDRQLGDSEVKALFTHGPAAIQ
jgi:hypothetical protein